MSTEDKISSDELTDLIGRVRVSFGGFEDADALIAEAERFAARIAEGKQRRDAAKAEEEGWFAAAHQREEETWKAEAERDQLRAELEAARPIVEAAAAWRKRIVDDPRFWADDEDFALIAAVDLYRSATSDHPSTTEEKP